MNNVTIRNFNCREHGDVKPVPKCPQCIEENKWADRVEFNAHDFGEMGKFIKVEYANNIIKEIIERYEQSNR